MASIRERKRSDGTIGYAVLWRHKGRQTSWTVDTFPAAEQVQRLVETVTTDPDVVDELMSAADDGPAITVRDAVERYVDELTGVTERTRADYRRDARNHIYPYLGAIPVSTLERKHVADWINRLDTAQDDDGELRFADKTIANIHGLLSGVMNYADLCDWRAGNPCRGLRLPRRDHGDEEMVCLSDEEWATLRAELPEHYRPFFDFLVGTGARWGEAVVVTGDDFAIDESVGVPYFAITKALRRDENSRPYVGPPKTRRSRRTVTLARQNIESIGPLIEGRPGDALVFTTRRTGSRLHHGNVRSRVWLPAVGRAMDPERHGRQAVDPERRGDALLKRAPRIHDLRHTHASWLIADGVDIVEVSRRLGHESVSTTADIYSHELEKQQKQAAEAAGRAMERGHLRVVRSDAQVEERLDAHLKQAG